MTLSSHTGCYICVLILFCIPFTTVRCQDVCQQYATSQRDCCAQTGCGYARCTNTDTRSTAFECVNNQSLWISWVSSGPGSQRNCMPDQCRPPSAVTCGSSEFHCLTGNQCVDISKFCNGNEDCGDKSDELDSLCQKFANTTTCGPDTFDCASNRAAVVTPFCIPQSFVCDGSSDCQDGEDEEIIMCATCDNGFKCKDDSCINTEYVCDRIHDCPDGDDEHENCTYTCRDDQFKCNNQFCVPKTSKCDGNFDCGDGLDEADSTCNAAPESCPAGQLMCKNIKCIDILFACNSQDDCGDNSDEDYCQVNECDNKPCSHNCVNTVISFYCTCRPGYRLNEDRTTCDEIDECMETPYQCTQKCQNSPGTFSCSCDDGYELQVDQQTCRKKDNMDAYLIFANRYYIRNISMDATFSETSHQDNKFVHVIDFDYEEGFLYLADAGSKQIKRIKIGNYSDVTLLNHRHLYGVEGLAFDWISKKIYWTDNDVYRIFVSEADGTHVRTIVSSGTPRPRAIVVYPAKGLLYWSDWGIDAFIGQIDMDGKNQKRLIDDGVFWPNGLVIDYVTDRLFWADAYLDEIGCANLDGSNRFTVLSNLAHPYALTLFEDMVYWSDWNLKKLEMANAFDGSNRTLLLETLHPPYDIHVYHPLRQKKSPNPCGTNNGGCSHLCLISAGGSTFSCSCPDDFTLKSDQKTCEAACSMGMFECGTSDHKCIPVLWKCDNKSDCKGGEDETGCPPRVCTQSQFQCKNNQCLPMSDLCNSNDDCGDNSDEEDDLCNYRVCALTHFSCSNGKCIPKEWECDTDNDCGDGSDEAPNNTKCVTPDTTVSCASNEFMCDNNKCIPKIWQCDFDDDCGDKSDEPREQCASRACPAGWTKCLTNYRCIPSTQVCDGKDDCRDNSDERAEVCPVCKDQDEFECKNGKCIPKRWLCDFDDDCKDNSDEDPTICENKYRNCSEVEFRCQNQKCILKTDRCNRQDNCGDESDEDCEPDEYTCRTSEFQCASGHCIPGSFECDGGRDCRDMSDELHCGTRYPGRYCTEDMFTCKNNICVSPDFICDGDDDCGDGSDETNEECISLNCTAMSDTRFRCNNGRCIPQYRLCDKVNHCGDGSDENNFDLCPHEQEECYFMNYRCNNGNCTGYRNLCNGVDDCGDFTDEKGCHHNVSSCRDAGCEQQCILTTSAPGAQSVYCYCNDSYQISRADKKKCDDVDECATYGKNYCSQICLNLKGNYTCNCTSGFRFRGQQCEPTQGEDKIVLISEGYSIRRYYPAVNTYVDVIISEKKIVAIDVDVKNRQVYWVDEGLKAVKRAYIPTEFDDIAYSEDMNVPEIVKPEGIAFDWITKNIYFTDSGRRAIFVVDQTGRYFKSIVTDSVTIPKNIVVSPEIGLMFWIEAKPGAPKIERAWMNGRGRKTVVGDDLVDPLGLAIDYYMNNRLFWADPKRNRIETVNIDGSDRYVINLPDINNPVGLDVYGSSLYWISRDQGNVVSHDKFGRGVNHTLVTGLLLPFDIKIFQQQRYNTNVRNPCPTGDRACLPLCLLQPGTRGPVGTCACPDKADFILGSDNKCNIDTVMPTPVPTLSPCTCQNNGYCDVVGINRRLQCLCPPGFYGVRCELRQGSGRSTFTPPVNPYYTTTLRSPEKVTKEKSDKTVQIAVPLAILALLLIIGLVVIFVLYQRGKLGMKKSGHGEFRAGPPGMNGTNSANGAAVMDPMSVQYSASDSNVAIANPTYDKVQSQNGAQANVDHEYATITPGGINISMEDPVNLPKKQ